MRGLRPLAGVFKQKHSEIIERRPLDVVDLVPESRRCVITKSLEALEITMYSGALLDSVSSVAGALIVKKEFEDDSEEANLADRAIALSMKDLGFHAEVLSSCDGDHEEATRRNFDTISGIVNQDYLPKAEIVQPADIIDVAKAAA